MAFLVQDLLRLPSMKKARVVAGSRGIDTEISNIMVMEAPDIAKWLQPGQMLLSSLYSMQESSAADMTKLVQQTKQLHGAGLIIKTNRFVETIPPALITACEHWVLPLIQIPGEVLYNDIQIETMQALFNEQVARLDYHRKLHMQFTEYALKQPSFEEVLRTLADIVDNPVLLMDHQKNVVCSTDIRMEQLKFLHPIPAAVKEMTFSYQKSFVLLEEPNRTATQISVEIPNIGNDSYYIVIADLYSDIRRMDYIALENAASFLQMRLIQVFAVNQVQQNYLNDLFDDLLNGKFATPEQIQETVQTLGLSLSIQYRVAVVRLYFEQMEDDNKTQYQKTMKQFVDRFRRDWKQSFYRIRADRIIFLLPAEELPHHSYKDRVRNSIEKALKSLPLTIDRYHAAIGDACMINQICDFGEQPLRMIQFSQNAGESFVLDNTDLGLYQFFTDIADSGKLLDLIPLPLQQLYQQQPVLSDTLCVYLDNRQQLKISANQLYIHPKTMRYRIDRIKELTLIDFDDADEVLKYNIGFRALRLVGKEIH